MTKKSSNFYAYSMRPSPGSPEAVQAAFAERLAHGGPLYRTSKFYGPKESRVDRPSAKAIANRKKRITLPRIG
jgi:hypothetical protein